MWSFPIRISLHVTRSIPAYSIPSKIKLPTSCSLQGPGVKFSLQGVRVGPLVKSARSSIWPLDRSGSILKGKGSKGSRTYRSVVPPRVGPQPRCYSRSPRSGGAEPARRAWQRRPFYWSKRIWSALVVRMEARLLPGPPGVGEESAELPLVAQVEQRIWSTSDGLVLTLPPRQAPLRPGSHPSPSLC